MNELPPELIDGILGYTINLETEECYCANPIFHVLSQKELQRKVLPFYTNPEEIEDTEMALHLTATSLRELIHEVHECHDYILNENANEYCNQCGSIASAHQLFRRCGNCGEESCRCCVERFRAEHEYYRPWNHNVRDIPYEFCTDCLPKLKLDCCRSQRRCKICFDAVCKCTDSECIYDPQYNQMYCGSCIKYIKTGDYILDLEGSERFDNGGAIDAEAIARYTPRELQEIREHCALMRLLI